jgi:hypothetical protein
MSIFSVRERDSQTCDHCGVKIGHMLIRYIERHVPQIRLEMNRQGWFLPFNRILLVYCRLACGVIPCSPHVAGQKWKRSRTSHPLVAKSTAHIFAKWRRCLDAQFFDPVRIINQPLDIAAGPAGRAIHHKNGGGFSKRPAMVEYQG